MQTVLVSGGAGYVGSHACLRLAEAGFRPVVFDSLVNGHTDFVRWGPLEVGDIRHRGRISAVLDQYRPVAVLHFAALIEVGESVRHPLRFYDNNVGGAVTLCEAAQAAGVKALVFSSTCATYGEPTQPLLTEGHVQAPLNPYGRSKLMVEQVLGDLDRLSGIRSVSLRYFNAAGADLEGRIGERHKPETHAVPLAIRAAMSDGLAFRIFGDDYPTPDGTAVRDYVHVLDLADAHVAALKSLLAGGPTDVFNLGTGVGTSVRELVDTVGSVAGRPLDVVMAARREGDAPYLVADNSKAREVLGWRPRFGLPEIVESAWRWHSAEAARAGVTA